jgi:CMP-N-acetylneuraminic acid synthetase
MPADGLVVIPARAGSKRLPGKNARPLDGRPLLAWTIRSALACPGLGRVFVSTDSPEYADLARLHGAEAPFLRSGEAATDQAPTSAVLAEAVDRYEKDLGYKARWITILQPTSPFRTPATIRRGAALFEASAGATVVAVARRRIPRAWMCELDAEGYVVEGSKAGPEIPGHYFCGAFYALTAETLRTTGGIYGKRVRAFTVEDEGEALDIDTPEDWALAERLAPSFRDAIFGPA